MKLSKSKRFLKYLALVGVLFQPRVAFAGLSDLQAFTKSSQDFESLLLSGPRRKTYRQSLERYLPPASRSTVEFEANMERLKKLRTEIAGLGNRLLENRKPMAFQYAAPQKPTYRFERATNAFHSIWLLGSFRESNKDACSDRDTLLVDKWTPLLQEANLFAVEKDGKYTGITLTLVPVKTVRAKYLLVAPNDPSSQLPTPLLEAFLRDYRKREPATLPFALIAHNGASSGAYQIYGIDAQGKRTSVLGPVKGFRLSDPMAERIVASVPDSCFRASVAISGSPSTAIDPASRAPASLGGPAIVGGASPTTINLSAQASATSGSPTVGGASPGGMSLQSSNTGKPAPGSNRLLQPKQFASADGQRPTQVRVTNVIKNTSTPLSSVRVGVASRNSNQVNLGESYNSARAEAIGVASSASSTATPIAAAPVDRMSPAQRTPRSVTPLQAAPLTNFDNAGKARGGNAPGARPSGGGLANSGIDRNALSAEDQKVFDAIDGGRRALQAGKPLTLEQSQAISALKTDNPQLQTELTSLTQFDYLKSGIQDAYKKALILFATNAKQARAVLQDIDDNDFCAHCPDCLFCQGLKRGTK